MYLGWFTVTTCHKSTYSGIQKRQTQTSYVDDVRSVVRFQIVILVCHDDDDNIEDTTLESILMIIIIMMMMMMQPDRPLSANPHTAHASGSWIIVFVCICACVCVHMASTTDVQSTAFSARRLRLVILTYQHNIYILHSSIIMNLCNHKRDAF